MNSLVLPLTNAIRASWILRISVWSRFLVARKLFSAMFLMIGVGSLILRKLRWVIPPNFEETVRINLHDSRLHYLLDGSHCLGILSIEYCEVMMIHLIGNLLHSAGREFGLHGFLCVWLRRWIVIQVLLCHSLFLAQG